MDENNINVIFTDSAADGGDVLKLYFSGGYSEYQKIPDYIWTIANGYTRLRRNSGFMIASENKKVTAEPGKACHLAVTTWNGLICTFNQVDLANPDSTATDGTFGQILAATNQGQQGRQLKIAVKLPW
ncbi:MAG: hypothetical protein ACRD2B_02245 [Terriglobia bacterium]